MIGTTVGHFRIERRLGAGGMGEVWLAHDQKLDRKVALKFLHAHLAEDSDARQRFQREARALAALDHPYVGAVYAVEDAYMVLAYIEGRALSEELPLPRERAHAIAPRIVEGLAAAHARGIVHRDMKTANVVLGPGDVPKIVDFGIALQGNDTRLTQTGQYSGTVGFTAPEVYKGALADARSDVFSLGVVLYELLTGKRPFTRGSTAAEMHAVLNETPAPFDSPLSPVVLRCLEKDPANRYKDAGEVAAAMRGNEPARRPARGLPRWAIAAIGVTFLALIAFWFVTQRSRPPKPPATPASATSDRRAVAVREFDNLSGDTSIDWMKRGVPELVSAALVQSPELDVYDGQRLADLLKNEKASRLDNAFLAKHGIARVIDGTIMKSGNQIQVLGRIVDTKDGRPVRSYNVAGPADSGLFHLVGGLIPNLQVALEVNLTGNKEAEGWLREITTTSADAYRLYLRGHQALLDSHWKEAASAFEKALELDSTFVAARSELSGAYWNLGEWDKLSLTRAAMQRMRPTADHREQLKIDLLEGVVAPDDAMLVRAASELTQIYPENRFYTYLLGRGYWRTKQYRRVLETLTPLMEQRYSWAYTYVLSARSAAALGDTAAARKAFELGVEVSNAEPELVYAYVLYLHPWGYWARARQVLEHALRYPALAENPIGEGELRLELAKNHLQRGDRAAAVAELTQAIPLIPPDDEAWPDADSLRKVFGIPEAKKRS